MQQRKSASGRPTGTDGFDFSYRMVVDSRYTKVAKGKSRLSPLLVIQGLLLLGNAILMLFSKLNGDTPDLITLSAAAILFVALLLGEFGRRRSRTSFLKSYILLSLLSTILFGICAFNNKLILQAFNGEIKSMWETQKVPIIEAVINFAGFFVQIFTISTTVSLISNMSVPKRSS